MTKAHKEIPPIWTTGWTDIFNTGTWRSSLPLYRQYPSPCHLSCTVNGEIPQWVYYLRQGDIYKAWHTIALNNPLPAVTGRVCHHPCEKSCNRKEYDEEVSIKSMERYIGDFALDNNWQYLNCSDQKNFKVAIVGGGPAGLSAAYHLKTRGYGIAIYETQPELGGLLRYGIPAYRLPRDILDQEIQRIINLGISVFTSTAITTAEEYLNLEKVYDAVFIATGAQKNRMIPIAEEQRDLVIDGLQLLARANNGFKLQIGGKVIVIGGGNTAIDAARTARRTGAKEVMIVYRRDRKQMPAQESEIVEAEEEGVQFYYLAVPVEIESRPGSLVKVTCQRMRLTKTVDGSGRAQVEYVPGSYFTLEADTIIAAIGTVPGIAGLKGVVDIKDSIIAVKECQGTSRRGFFAGGDVASQERYVSNAIDAGKNAALNIINYLENSKENVVPNNLNEVAFEDLNTFYFPQLSRVKENKLPAAERLNNFKEVQLGISYEQILVEAERCFNCGYCIQCDICFYYCPDLAIKKMDNAEQNYQILEQYCKGCGLCVEECPRGVMVLKEEKR